MYLLSGFSTRWHIITHFYITDNRSSSITTISMALIASQDRAIFIRGIPIPDKSLYIEGGPSDHRNRHAITHTVNIKQTEILYSFRSIIKEHHSHGNVPFTSDPKPCIIQYPSKLLDCLNHNMYGPGICELTTGVSKYPYIIKDTENGNGEHYCIAKRLKHVSHQFKTAICFTVYINCKQIN